MGNATPKSTTCYLRRENVRERGEHPLTQRGEKRRKEGEDPDMEADLGQEGREVKEETLHRLH